LTNAVSINKVTIKAIIITKNFLLANCALGSIFNFDIFRLVYSQNIKFFYGVPSKDNPMNDPTGEKCANGQSLTNSSVFMLSVNNGGLSERTCKVPAGKGLLIPVMVVAISDKEYPNVSAEELSESAKKDQDSVNSLYLKIDDREYTYQDLIKYRTHTTF
jgi:hypothetical protein